MDTTEIKLGKCYLARLSKIEMPVRLERTDPAGGWIARSLAHGRVVKIKDASQLIELYDNTALREIASETTPNRRSRIKGIVRRPPPTPLTETESGYLEIKAKRPKPQRTEVKIVLVRMNLLEAAHRVLTETKKPLTTREIVKIATERAYWVSDAATPHATLHAALSREIKAKGGSSRFAKSQRGKFVAR